LPDLGSERGRGGAGRYRDRRRREPGNNRGGAPKPSADRRVGVVSCLIAVGMTEPRVDGQARAGGGTPVCVDLPRAQTRENTDYREYGHP
jgi:hypothetical protein